MVQAKPVSKFIARKRCITCQRRRSLTRFAKNRHRKDGRCSECRECRSERNRDWYLKRQQETQGLYSIFVGMKQRCHNPKHDNFHYYGGRGIRVCKRWRTSFAAFFQWAMSHGYEPGLQIDRINNHAGYSPKNCRFVTPAQNAQNKRGRKIPTKTTRRHVNSQSNRSLAVSPRA